MVDPDSESSLQELSRIGKHRATLRNFIPVVGAVGFALDVH